MEKNFRFVSIIFLSLILTGFLSIPKAEAQQGSCYLQANDKDVFLVVYDLDRDGNQGSEIWQGRINRGESVMIKTPHGRFRYDYNDNPDVDQPLSGGSDRWCKDNETVLVP